MAYNDNLDMVTRALKIATDGGVGVTLTSDELSKLLGKLTELEVENAGLRRKLEKTEAVTNELFENAIITIAELKQQVTELERELSVYRQYDTFLAVHNCPPFSLEQD